MLYINRCQKHVNLISAFLGMYIKVFKIRYQYITEVCYVIFRSSEIKVTVWMKIWIWNSLSVHYYLSLDLDISFTMLLYDRYLAYLLRADQWKDVWLWFFGQCKRGVPKYSTISNQFIGNSAIENEICNVFWRNRYVTMLAGVTFFVVFIIFYTNIF